MGGERSDWGASRSAARTIYRRLPSDSLRRVIDENAFGLLISWLTVEDEEYGLEPADFVERIRAFRETVMETVLGKPLGSGLSVLELGHSIYFEIADGNQSEDPFVWLRRIRTALSEDGFESLGVISHGSRWVVEEEDDDEELPSLEEDQGLAWMRFGYSSEPLRRAFFVETAAHSDEDLPGWGPGLYLDTEAMEALGKRLKNAPTGLRVAGATFFRIGS